MRWIVSIILIIIFFNTLSQGLAFAISLALLWLMQGPEKQPIKGPDEAIINLTLLRQKLTELWLADSLEDAKYTHLCEQIEKRLQRKTAFIKQDPLNHQQKLDNGWSLIHSQAGQAPPWQPLAKPAVEPQIEAPKTQPMEHIPLIPVVETVAQQSKIRVATKATPKKPTSSVSKGLKNVLRNLLLPLLWQNIGWFIGALMFVSGSIFLVTYTTGFIKAFTVLLTLSLYAALLFWGSYQMRRSKPNLTNASNILALMAVLLMPLVMATAARLIHIASGQFGLQLLAIPLSLFIIYAFNYAVHFASGLVARDLGQAHARVLMGLSLLQFLIPLLNIFPYWPLLAFIHLCLVVLLMTAIKQFLRQWLYSIFINQRYSTYYFIGSLLFASLVSFVHLTLGSPITLPRGYAGPFLMLVCLALFYVDLHFKQWVKKSIWLSRFSFVIYGLSVIALLLSWQGQMNTALFLTLIIASILYANMLWHYLTLAPLYLLIAALSGLYGHLVLSQVPAYSYFLSSLPGLILLFGLRKLAIKRQSLLLTRTIQSILVLLILALVLFSLYHGKPSLISMFTPLTATLLLWILSTKPQQFKPQIRYYFIVLLVTLTAFYTPRGLIEWQFIGCLMSLAMLWGIIAVKIWRNHGDIGAISALINSSLVSFVLALALHHNPTMYIAQFMVIGCFTLWLSLHLRLQRFFYLSLISVSLGAILLKQSYFDTLSTGTSKFFLALVLAGLWWGFETYQQRLIAYRKKLAVEKTSSLQTFFLFAYWPADPNFWPNRMAMVLPPIRQATVLLWMIGLSNISGLYLQQLNAPVFSLFLATLLSFFISWRNQALWLFPFALCLTLFTLIEFTNISNSSLLVACIGYSGVLWWIGLHLGLKTRDWRDRNTLHFYHYATLFSSLLVSLLLQLFVTLYYFSPISLFMLLKALLFAGLSFALMTYYYRQLLHSYLACLCLTMLLLILGYYYLPLQSVGFISALWSLILFSLSLQLKPLMGKPIRHMAIFFTVFALLQSISHYFSPWFSPTLFVLMPITMVALFARNHAAALRSLILPVLLTVIFSHALDNYQANYYYSFWVFGLWFISQKILPIINHRWPAWSISETSWLGYGFLISLWTLHTFEYGLLLCSLIYSGMMLVHFQRVYFAWFIAIGLSILGLGLASLSLALGFLWLNMMLILTPLWHKYGEKYAQSTRQLLIKPLEIMPLLLFIVGLILFFVFIFLNKTGFHSQSMLILGCGLLFSFLNLYAHYRLAHYFHAILFSLFGLALLLPLTLDIILLLMTLMITGVLFFLHHPKYQQIIGLLYEWITLCFIVTLISLLPINNSLFTQTGLLSLLALTSVIHTLITPFAWQISIWRNLAYALLFIVLHLIWLLLFDLSVVQLLPEYALQSLLILLLFQSANNKAWLPERLISNSNSNSNITGLLLLIAVCEWLGHIGVLLLIGDNTYTNWDHFIAIIALLLILKTQYKPQWQTQSVSIYRLSLLVLMGLAYVRFLILGIVPFTLWDTLLLLTLSYGLLLLQPKPVIAAWQKMTLIMPILTLCTVPWQLSVHTTTTLLAVSMIYIFMPRKPGQYNTFYIGMIGVNIGIYLWIPQFANNLHLLQLYTIPASISVLLILQLHALDLTKSTKHSIRLMALALVYSSAMLDVFLRPELSIFILAIGLSLIGIIIGLGFQIRAFIYNGIGFLLLNIVGQLLQFYPQQSLGKALFLMLLGSLITIGMIIFNIKREVIMQRINLAREDLAQWS